MIRLGRFLFLCLCLVLLTACNLPANDASVATLEPASAIETATTELPRPTPTPAPLGTLENPLIVALPPGSSSSETRVEAGKDFAEQLSEVTGYSFVVVAPDSYAKLVEAMGYGNAHVAVLSPHAYAFAFEKRFANATFASLKSGEIAYGAQFIARAEAGFKPYFDARQGRNTVEAAAALSQFHNKKPCWPDETSLSGYVIPVGILAQNSIPIRSGAILQGQPTVVRAVYVGGICDFGATYIDARSFPAVLDEYPDVLEQVDVIWRIPAMIPYDVMVISSDLSPEISQAIWDALFRITGMQAGRQVLGGAYGNEDWERVTDAFFDDFRLYLDDSGVDLENLLD